tara:strand:+ start:605 stop:751 length:147 start_codon:yes stop_codon:yes gene_type:complete
LTTIDDIIQQRKDKINEREDKIKELDNELLDMYIELEYFMDRKGRENQ